MPIINKALILVVPLVAGCATYRAPPPGPREATAARSSEGPSKYLDWAKNDGVRLVSQPFDWTGQEWGSFALQLGLTAAVFPLDAPVRDEVQRQHDDTVSADLRDFRDYYTGNFPGILVLSVGMFATGLGLEDDKLADAGFLGTESIMYSGLAGVVLKSLAGRDRPNTGSDPYEFRGPGGKAASSAFVSGEALISFAFASSVGEVYDNPWVSSVLYALAVATSAERIDSNAHWSSDVVGGALLGYGIGKSIVHMHAGASESLSVVPIVQNDLTGVGLQVGF